MPTSIRNATHLAQLARRSGVRHGLLIAIGTGIVAIAGCSDPLTRIDNRIRQVIETRSASLGPDTLVASGEALTVESYISPTIDEKQPGTINPSVTQLSFDSPEQERTDRMVAARLEAFSANALGVGPLPDGTPAAEPLDLALADTFQLAQRTGPEFLFAEEDYILAAVAVLQQRHLFSPRFFNDTAVEVAGFGDAGNFNHALNIVNTLRVTRQLQTGGSLEASWIVSATEQLRDAVSRRYVQSSTLALSADIPLLRGAGRVASENLIQAERNLIYEARDFERTRRELLVSVAGDYFSLIQQQSAIENQLRQIEGLRLLEQQTAARVDAGRLRPFQQDLAANQVLNAEASLASLRERFILALDQFKIRLGIPVSTPLNILPIDFDVPEPDITQVAAANAALAYRLDLQTQRDRLDDDRRAIRNARNDLLPDFNLGGSVGVPTSGGSTGSPTDPTGGLSFDFDEFSYSASATLGLPLDREIERLALRAAIVDLQRAARQFDDFRDNLIVA
ncbi:MAG: TolC family protein, partial [Planctomycetota bacterium]